MDQNQTPPATNSTPDIQQPAAQSAPAQPMPPAMPETPPVPAPTTPPPANPQPEIKKWSNKIMLLIIVVIVLALIGAVMWYMIMARSKTTPQESVPVSQQSNYQQPQPSPSLTPSASEQVESIDIGASDPAELQTVQQDVNGL